jgi:hypothetical protein
MSQEETLDNTEELKSEVHELQHMVTDLQIQLQENQQQNAVSIMNELAALRKLVPYLLLENETLKNDIDNRG